MKTSTHSLVICMLLVVLCACSPKSGENSISGYSIHWKYIVKPETTETFEFEYGPKGTWYKLFDQSQDYKGSFLQRSSEESNVYLLIDT